MTATDQNAVMWAGDDLELAFEVLNEVGSPIDLFGISARWGCSPNLNTQATVIKTTTNGGITIEDDLIIVHLNPADTESFGDKRPHVHELEITNNQGETATVAAGQLMIHRTILPAG